MKYPFILSCESTVDVPYAYMQEREIPVTFYSYTVNGKEYEDDMGRDETAMPRFYSMLKDGFLPKTSQISKEQYVEFLDGLLQQDDVLHIAFGSGMTASVNNAMAAAEELRPRYPDRKIQVIDSTCSSSGYGLLVDGAADMRDMDFSLEDTAAWVMENRKHVHHQFFSTDLKHYRRSGRMSGPAAMAGALLSICPIMRLDDKGRIIAYDKIRGKRNAIARTADEMEEHAVGGRDYSGKCWICHSNCIEQAELMKEALRQRFPRIQGDIRIFDIGTIIAGHCGPGTVAIFFFGDERPDMSVKDKESKDSHGKKED